MGEAKIPPDIAKMSFEEALEELQDLVRQLEKGESKLEDAVRFYERGALLKRHCEAKLRDAQEKVAKIVIQPDGSVGTTPADFD